MELRKEFEKEKGYNCYAYRQDYAGGNQYKYGFNDDYVEWLESKVNNVVLDDVSKCYSEKDMDTAYDRGFKDGNQRDLTGSIIELL